jgi:hypothetical protein
MPLLTHEPIRTLYSREHATVYPGQGVFLAGPTPPDGQMEETWRRVLIERLVADPRLDPSMIVVAPEPRSGRWEDITVSTGRPQHDQVTNGQIAWEWQYLGLCDITVFWLATYWAQEKAAPFAGNIGPTTRWEFGFYFQEYAKDPARRTFIVGAPEDAESVKWPRRLVKTHNLPWHTLEVADKAKLVPDSLVEAVVEALVSRR